jgi:phosphatidylglycerol:prolipoprotein diacylglycerol transferase
VIGYFIWVAVGIVLAFVARRWQGNVTGLDDRERTGILLVAIGGAIAGAYGFELIADVRGWAAPLAPGAMADRLPIGGRTVLGGILGGWIAVEIAKRKFGIRRPTGDGFALPLAVALAFGRLGCVNAGCCMGRVCEVGSFASIDANGTPHVPVPLMESIFHCCAAVVLAHAVRRGWWVGYRLAVYLCAYALVRFVLEHWRMNPPVIDGLTYYQVLAMVLFILAVFTCWTRAARQGPPAPR